MPEEAPIPQKRSRRPAIIAGVIVIAMLAVGAPAGYLAAYSARIMPGVKIASIEVGGLTPDEALAKVGAAAAIYAKSAGTLTYEGEKRRIGMSSGSILKINAKKAVELAYAVGRESNWAERPLSAFSALTKGNAIALPYAYDSAAAAGAMAKLWSGREKDVKDARLSIRMSGDALSGADAVPEENGFEFDYARAASEIGDRIGSLDSAPIELHVARTEAAITAADIHAAASSVPYAMGLAPIALSADEKHWTLSAGDLAPLIEAYKENGVPSLRISREAAIAYFKKLASTYDVAAADTKFEIDPSTGKMTSFSAGADGRKINIGKSVDALVRAFADRLAGRTDSPPWNVTVETAKSQVITETAKELGIVEAIGVGRSDFSGSSSNRIKNIKNGISKLNGQLIAPDAEFSIYALLEPITIENGYAPEQIIKDNLIQTDVGGGLCQIGTTMFRTAMMAGLPITERQNHSLVVHYYSDPSNGNPGTDATIFGPHPDLRFKNDTGHWLLLTTAINVGRHALAFTLWGTPDGRQGSYTPPKVIRWIEPAKEPVMTPSIDVEPGKEKCQNPFRGADTVFTYTVKKADGTAVNRDFYSHYKALPKMCLVGATAEPAAQSPASAPSAALPPEATQGN